MKNKRFIYYLAVFIVIAIIQLLNINADKIAVYQADKYYRKNDIANTQKYYEKAFDLGYKNSKSREIYVNSIINSPFDIDSQVKLIKFLQYPIEDSSSLKVKLFLYNLRREILNKYPGNYISQATYNQKIMRWDEFPITYSFTNPANAPEGFVNEIENAFKEWANVTDKKIYFKKVKGNSNINITFEDPRLQTIEDKKYVIAYTYPIICNNQLKTMNMIFYTKNHSNEPFSKVQIYNTALHEIAHALGFMGHSSDKHNIMYISKESEEFFEHQKEQLTEADINSIKLLYSIKPDITNVKTPKGEYLSSLVLGDKDDISIAKKREAKNYIKKAPNLPNGYIDLAENYVSNNDYAMALKYLNKALYVANSDDIKAIIYYNLAIVYYNLHDLDLALENINLSAQIEITTELKYLRAEINKQKGDIEKAIDDYNDLINENPKEIDYAIALANLYIQEKHYMKARKVLKYYIKNNPNSRNNKRFQAYGFLIRAFL